MRCVHINIRKVAYILLSLLVNHVNNIYTTGNDMDQSNKIHKIVQSDTTNKSRVQKSSDLVLQCPQNQKCEDLNANCLDCELDKDCIYGSEVNTKCKPKSLVKCIGDANKEFQRSYNCRYCYQTNSWEHSCKLKAGCNAIAAPQSIYATNCTVHDNVLCLGNRTFNKNVRCNWTSGYRWTTALALSITLGGFGADRFYLGHWQEGIGKLFSFGGLGVWTLIDVLLISLHYLGPADGSLYI